MKLFEKNVFYLLAVFILAAGMFFASSISAAQDEQPDYSNGWIKYKSASFQATSTPTVTNSSGLWNLTTIDGKQNAWYYGQAASMDYDTGSSNSGSLTMQVDLSSALISPTLTFDHKYQTESSSTSYDKLTIAVGSDILWKRTDKESEDATGSFGWTTESLDMTSYAGSTVFVTFSFDTVDSYANSNFGWAVHNVQVSSQSSTGPGGTVTQTVFTGSNLKIKQIDNGNFPYVDMYVTVTDSSGSFISGLDESDFKLKENYSVISPLTVESVSSGGAALSIGITVDKSGSMGSSGIASAQSAVSDFIDLSTGAQDEFGIVAFNSSVTTLKDFTTDKQALKDAVDTISAWGTTAFYDAVYETLTLTSTQPGVKAVIAFTDGDDTSSSKTTIDVINYAKQLSIPVYTIGIGSVDTTVLQMIANQTGGSYSAADFSNLSAIYQSLQTTILQQYKISFQSQEDLCTQRCYDLQVMVAGGATYTASDCVSASANCNPPVITLHGDTKDMLQPTGAPAFGSSFEIKALVTDPDGDNISVVNLYYRTSGSSDTYTKLTMSVSSLLADLYTADIPAADYADPGIDFYITASDGTYTKTSQEYSIGSGTSSGTTGNVEQIYIVAPKNNEVLSYGSTSGALTFSFTKIANTAKYVLTLQLKDLLAGTTVPLEVELIPPSSGTSGGSFWYPTSSTSTSTGTSGFTEVLTGMQYLVQLNAAGWDSMAAWDITWGVEAYDSTDTLIGSTFDQQVPAKYVNSMKFTASSAITLSSPSPGSVLDQSDAAPVFKWDTYTGVATYELILAHVSGASFNPVIPYPGQTLNLITMDDSAWSTMPTGTWYWTVLGKDASGNPMPSDYTIFDFTVQ